MTNTTFNWLAGTTIAFIGDSITADGRSNYVSLLISTLSDQLDASGINIVNSGVDSSSVIEALDRLPDLLLEHDPDVCVFFLGVNDSKIFHGIDKPLLPVDIYKDGYAHLLDAADKGRSRTKVLLTIPPLLFDEIKAGTLLADYWYWNQKDYDEYNDAIRKLALDKGCVLADVASSFRTVTNRRLFYSDGVHPNIYGHQLIAETLLDALRRSPK